MQAAVLMHVLDMLSSRSLSMLQALTIQGSASFTFIYWNTTVEHSGAIVRGLTEQ